MSVSDRQRSGWLNHQDMRLLISHRFVFRAARNHVNVPRPESDRVFDTTLTQPDHEVAGHHEEQFVRVLVGVPNILTMELRHSYIVIIELRDNVRTPPLLKGSQGLSKTHWFIHHDDMV